MPTLKVDGREVTVDPGTTILQAAEKLGIEVPTFCYHPGLSIAANCRMCLVDSNKSPKPVPACHAQVVDGLEVQTASERIKKTRKAVLEFILLNHPVDCPICDQAGECVLQDHYFKYSAQPSRLFHRKQHKAKAKVLGPDVILDAERCILCTRCVRFCDEVAKESQLDVVNRGEHSEITTFPGKQLDNPYAGNTVDICPVGALTSRDFRFKTRVWMLQSESSVCPECARGCAVRVDTFENVVRRVKPRHNPEVNKYWMCDTGRLAYRGYLDGRMEGPTVVEGGRRFASATQKVLDAAARALSGPKSGVAVVLSPWLTNEDAFVWAKLLERNGPLHGAQVFVGGRRQGFEDAILLRADKNPNRAGLDAILAAKGIAAKPFAVFRSAGVDTVVVTGDEHDVSDDALIQLEAVPNRIVLGAFKTPFWDMASHFLPVRTHFEKDGSFTNFEGVVQRIRRAATAAATCKSEGWYGLKLGQALGLTLDLATPQAIFARLADEVPAFGGMRAEGSPAGAGPAVGLDGLGEHGLRLGAGVPVAATATTTTEPGAAQAVAG